MDETHPFAVPFRPYAWSNYPGSEFKHLVHPTYHHHPAGLELSASTGLYGDRAAEASLFTERGTTTGHYTDFNTAVSLFERGTAPGLYSNPSLHSKVPDAKAKSDLLCTRLLLNGSYKCIKCSKVHALYS